MWSPEVGVDDQELVQAKVSTEFIEDDFWRLLRIRYSSDNSVAFMAPPFAISDTLLRVKRCKCCNAFPCPDWRSYESRIR
jgi:hypothetical protein